MKLKDLKKLKNLPLLLSLWMGFSSGLPLLLHRSTLKTWLVDGKINLAQIGFFSLVVLPYSFKFLWSPLLDYWSPFGLGRRRGWLVLSQMSLAVGLFAISQIPMGQNSLAWVGVIALWVAFWGSVQDIAVDAYRRESLKDSELGVGISLYVFGYRMALLASGAGALFIASETSFNVAYQVMAMLMCIAAASSIFIREPEFAFQAPVRLKEAVIDPFLDFFKRPEAILILAFAFFYKVGESVASDWLNPFFRTIGFSLAEIASVSKIVGLIAMVLGGFAGGWLMRKISLRTALVSFGILQSFCLLGFSILAVVGPKLYLLGVSVAAENFTSGMASTAFLTYLSLQSNRKFTAVQYSLLSSLTQLAGALLGPVTGILTERIGWAYFFIVCFFFTIPGLFLARKVA